jgi:putative ABC transport system permease protein
MFRHYFKTAIGNLTRYKLYSVINIVGLSVGLACAIFIVLFLRDELSYDKWIPGSDHLYRVEATVHFPGRPPLNFGSTPFPVPSAMHEQIPEVTAMTRVSPEEMTVTTGDRQFPETVMAVDANFFRVIQLPLIQGDPASVLADPESIVLSQSTARKYFGALDPVGKILTVSAARCERGFKACHTDTYPLTVTGVVRDLPHNTHLVGDIFIPNTSRADGVSQLAKESWLDIWSFGYVALAPGATPDTVLAKLRPIIDRSVDPTQAENINLKGSDFEQIRLTQFQQVHLTSDNYGGLKPSGSAATVYGFAIIAALILLLACFNFTNLATARAMLRAREICLRKTVGAKQWQLIVQFLSEALLTALLSLIVALGLVESSLPFYNGFLGRPVETHFLADWPLFVGAAAAAIAAGLIGGAYPALVLSRFRPTALLRSAASAGSGSESGSGHMRLILVVAQFAVSIGLGIATIVVFRQIEFARNMDLGFRRDGIVVIRSARNLQPTARESFARALRAEPGIAGVALSNTVPLDGRRNTGNVRVPGQSQVLAINTTDISPEFPEVYDMRLLAGRLLSSTHGEDLFSSDQSRSNAGRNVLINMSAAHLFGYTAPTAVGKAITLNNVQVTVAGVLADARINGARETPAPTVFFYNPDSNIVVSIRVHATHLSDTLGVIDKTWRSFAPESAIQRDFLSDTFEDTFQSDEKQGAMFALFVGIAIFIACLGLFGLAAFTADRRIKEIGVRKVFGARDIDVVRLLLRQFSIPVLTANLIAWPVAWYYLNAWLANYAYRIFLNPLYFLLAGAIALAIAWATVSLHAVRVARSNPIHALRNE